MKIEDVLIINAMGEPGGGRTHITARLIRHHNLINYTDLDTPTVQKIFNTLANHFLKNFNETIKEKIPSIID